MTSARRILRRLLSGVGTLLLAAAPAESSADPIPVRIEKSAEGFQVHRSGKPYFIRGAGGGKHLDALIQSGGNSIRTWDADQAERILDEAHRLGLTVCVGIWLGHERHGFNYADSAQVAAQKERARQAVMANKNHPAVLMWGIGNEMEGDGRNPAVWKAVDDIAAMIKEIDPVHPTMTVVAGAGDEKVRQFVAHCINVDVLGVNAYGDLGGLVDEMKRQGLDRPYVLTEFGPTGWWQVGKTSWGEEFEPNSTAKAETYRRAYRDVVMKNKAQCLGSYAFLWGNKQEHTHTWFGMFLPSGERTPAVDVMTYCWTGRSPRNRCPTIGDLELSAVSSATPSKAGEHVYSPRTKLTCAIRADDPDGDKLDYAWEVRSASTDKRSGGDPEAAPPVVRVQIAATGSQAVISAPEQPGAYRVFVYVRDGQGNASTANVPILIADPKRSDTGGS